MPPVRVPLVAIDALPAHGLRHFRVGWRAVWVRRTAQGVTGFYDRCTHQGGALRVSGERFVCSRHAAEFDTTTGQRLSGEAPEGSVLSPAALVVEAGQVYLELPDDDMTA